MNNQADKQQKAWKMLVLEGCIDSISSIASEEDRLEVVQALFNIIVHGGFCDDKQPLVPVRDNVDANHFNLVKANVAEKVSALRSSMGRIIH